MHVFVWWIVSVARFFRAKHHSNLQTNVQTSVQANLLSICRLNPSQYSGIQYYIRYVLPCSCELSNWQCGIWNCGRKDNSLLIFYPIIGRWIHSYRPYTNVQFVLPLVVFTACNVFVFKRHSLHLHVLQHNIYNSNYWRCLIQSI